MNLHQTEFAFPTGPGPDGETAWRNERQQALLALADKLGLPLEHEVEVRLLDGVVLRGQLRVLEETLFLDHVDTANVELAVGRATFRHSDIESCIRLDDPP